VVDTRRTTYRISYTEYFSYLHEVECEILHLQALILARISEKVADPWFIMYVELGWCETTTACLTDS